MNNIFAELISIGDEILYGQTLDTNSHWISAALDKIGIKVKRKVTISDTEEAILEAFKEADAHADIILITGGLGPTKDDLTKPCLAKYFDSDMYTNTEVLRNLEARFAKRGRTLNNLNKGQAELPKKCEVVENKYGTAPGMWFNKNGKVFVSMPGVPKEMKYMMQDTVLPRLKEQFEMPIIIHQMVKTSGIPESELAEKLEAWEDNLPQEIKLAYLPGLKQVKLRLTAIGADKEKLQRLIDTAVAQLKPLIERYIFATEDVNHAEAIGALLKERGLTIACAESCTGGYLSKLITENAGSSAYFQGSIIPYHNELKINVLGVKPQTIAQYGAVSKQTVQEMAENVRKLMRADIGLATSGIAGPSGGTKEKPVGTVWIALADGENTQTKLYTFPFDREGNIDITANTVLNLLRETLSVKK